MNSRHMWSAGLALVAGVLALVASEQRAKSAVASPAQCLFQACNAYGWGAVPGYDFTTNQQINGCRQSPDTTDRYSCATGTPPQVCVYDPAKWEKCLSDYTDAQGVQRTCYFKTLYCGP